ncbi:uncharacterized protein VTP21DRAFT_10479 [Calcarisporiella thermophila]|uniref:uncharacterized protein n=1 Tax=Calcarisporiella thermophila TaxID=911321 RepID=UPI0037423843
MTNYWFISVPSNPSRSATFQNLRANLSSSSQNDLAEIAQFDIPEFKIGTLDQLVLLSDDLVKYDSTFEQIVLKLVDILRNLLGSGRMSGGGTSQQNRSVENFLSVNEKTVDQYLKTFQWNAMKYRTDKSLSEIVELLSQEANSIDTLMKNKMNNYNQVRGNLQALQRKETGNLAVRNLAGIVKREHFVLDSEYLVTLLVAVPKSLYKDWMNRYETMTQMVVPRSSQKIAEDEEYGLFNVTLFRRVADEFSNKCREQKFVVRDFTYDEQALAGQKKDLEEVAANERELSENILRLARTNFGEIFSIWMHLKALRIFVESVLRYGLPPDFLCVVLKPRPKSERKLRDKLNDLYGHLGGVHGQTSKKEEDVGADEFSSLIDKNYHPYVFFELSWEPERR